MVFLTVYVCNFSDYDLCSEVLLGLLVATWYPCHGALLGLAVDVIRDYLVCVFSPLVNLLNLPHLLPPLLLWRT